jgi:hypothetical protein
MPLPRKDSIAVLAQFLPLKPTCDPGQREVTKDRGTHQLRRLMVIKDQHIWFCGHVQLYFYATWYIR